MAIDALTAYRNFLTNPEKVYDTERFIDTQLNNAQWARTANRRVEVAGELEYHFDFQHLFTSEEKRVLQELYASWTLTFTETSGATRLRLVATNIKL